MESGDTKEKERRKREYIQIYKEVLLSEDAYKGLSREERREVEE